MFIILKWIQMNLVIYVFIHSSRKRKAKGIPKIKLGICSL